MISDVGNPEVWCKLATEIGSRVRRQTAAERIAGPVISRGTRVGGIERRGSVELREPRTFRRHSIKVRRLELPDAQNRLRSP